MNPADVMDLPVGLINEMNEVIRDENRRHRAEARKARAHSRRKH